MGEDWKKEAREAEFRLYRNIRKLRLGRNLTTKELAGIIGASELDIIRAEACVEIDCLYAHHIEAVCRYFDVSADTLFEMEL